MRRQDDRHLLYIEPWTRARAKPLVDELTRKMAAALNAATHPGVETFGYHTCACGAASHGHEWILPTGVVTNTLCVHYLAYHRRSVPKRELAAVANLESGEAEPSKEQLEGSFHGRIRRIARWWKPPLWLEFWRWGRR